VEGLSDRGGNRFGHGFRARQHIARRHADDRQPALVKSAVASGVARWTITAAMRLAIDLDDEPRLGAVKIEHIGR
jgi:hypothetical protein